MKHVYWKIASNKPSGSKLVKRVKSRGFKPRSIERCTKKTGLRVTKAKSLRLFLPALIGVTPRQIVKIFGDLSNGRQIA